MSHSVSMDRDEAIKGVDLFAALRPAQLSALVEGSRLKRHKAGAVVVEEGEPGHSLYVILAGRVGMRKLDDAGEFVYFAEQGPGGYFGEMSLFDGKPRSADVVAMEDSEFLIIERSEFVRCVETNVGIALKIIATLSERLREASRRMSERHPVRQRLAAFLLREAERQGRRTEKEGVRFRLSLTRQQIAEQIHTRRETVSRELSALQDAGAMRFQGRDVVVDPLMLTGLAGDRGTATS
jgi:CRP/FNR family cyclic AMP-dependent transcriptional regulator